MRGPWHSQSPQVCSVYLYASLYHEGGGPRGSRLSEKAAIPGEMLTAPQRSAADKATHGGASVPLLEGRPQHPPGPSVGCPAGTGGGRRQGCCLWLSAHPAYPFLASFTLCHGAEPTLCPAPPVWPRWDRITDCFRLYQHLLTASTTPFTLQRISHPHRVF